MSLHSNTCYVLDTDVHTVKGCIIVRLWGIHRSITSAFTPSSRVRSRHISFADVTLIIVESALLYTATVVLSVVLEVAKTNAYYGVTDIVSIHLFYRHRGHTVYVLT